MRVNRALPIVLAAGLIAGCGGAADDPGGETSSTVEDREPVPDPVALIGETQRIGGASTDQGGNSREIDLAVTPTAVEDPAENEFVAPGDIEPGTRWVRVDARIVNRGDTYDANLPPFSLTTNRGDQVPPNLSSAPWRSLGGTLLPDDKLRGSLGFLVPKGAQIEELRFDPSFGSSEKVARWDISTGGGRR